MVVKQGFHKEVATLFMKFQNETGQVGWLKVVEYAHCSPETSYVGVMLDRETNTGQQQMELVTKKKKKSKNNIT